MNEPGNEELAQLVVELFVNNLAVSLDFYTTLGFKVNRTSEDFAVLAWDKQLLFLDQRAGLPKQAQLYSNIRVVVADVEPYWQLVQEKNYKVVAPVADRYYGLRDFTILDPDGFGIRFAMVLR